MSRPRPARALLGAAAVLILLAGIGAAIFQVQSNHVQDQRGKVLAAAQRLLTDRAAVLDDSAVAFGSQFTDGRQGAGEVLRSLPASAFSGRVLADLRFQPVTSAAQPDGGSLDRGVVDSAAVRAAAAVATDQGGPVATVAEQAGGTRELVVVWPLYRRPLPARTAERRAASSGWAVAAVRVDWLAEPASHAAQSLGYRLRQPQLRPVSAGAVRTVAADAVVVELGSSHPPRRALPWVLLGALAGTTAAAAALVMRRRRDLRTSRAEADSLREQIQLLADLGVTAQETLDVSLTLPAMLLQLSTRLQLDHVAVLAGSEPHLVEVLALGQCPSTATRLRFPLHRSLRTIGALEIARRAPISATERETVQAIADVISGSMFNSELFEREQAAVQQLRDVDRLKDNFLGTVSHELRTPLSILVGYSAMLRKRWATMAEADKVAAVTTIETHVGALTNLVNDLLDFVADRNSAQQVNLVPVRLATPVRELVERYAPLLGKHTLRAELDEGLEAVTDPRAVERILTNLLSNASKYSPPGSVISVTVTPSPDGVELAVLDQGPGIADEERALVFERFYRGTTDAARSTRGTGIGLTIVKTWLELVGARCEVRSHAGAGTRMSVVFPASSKPVAEAGQIVWCEDHPPTAVRKVP